MQAEDEEDGEDDGDQGSDPDEVGEEEQKQADDSVRHVTFSDD